MNQWLAFASTILLLAACSKGSDDGGGTGPSQFAIIVNTSLEAPPCDEGSKGRLIYVQSETTFKYCDGTNWTAIDLKGKDGAGGTAGTNGTHGTALSEVWRFHTSTYVGAADICSESSTDCFIGTVQLIKFSDGNAFVSVAGSMVRADSGSDSYYSQFGNSFFLPASAAEQSAIFKIDSYASCTIRYNVTIAATPTFKATVDNDGSFANNTDISSALTKQ